MLLIAKHFLPNTLQTDLYYVTASLVEPLIFYPIAHVVCQRKSKCATTSWIPWNSTAVKKKVYSSNKMWVFLTLFFISIFPCFLHWRQCPIGGSSSFLLLQNIPLICIFYFLLCFQAKVVMLIHDKTFLF